MFGRLRLDPNSVLSTDSHYSNKLFCKSLLEHCLLTTLSRTCNRTPKCWYTNIELHVSTLKNVRRAVKYTASLGTRNKIVFKGLSWYSTFVRYCFRNLYRRICLLYENAISIPVRMHRHAIHFRSPPLREGEKKLIFISYDSSTFVYHFWAGSFYCSVVFFRHIIFIHLRSRPSVFDSVCNPSSPLTLAASEKMYLNCVICLYAHGINIR